MPSEYVAGMVPTDEVFVDSSPRYIFSPLAPYRIKMVRPGARFIVVLRDPTDRCVIWSISFGACEASL